MTGTGAVAGDTIQLYDGTGTGTPLGTSYTLLASDITATFANVQTGTLTDGTTYIHAARIIRADCVNGVQTCTPPIVTEDTSAPSAPAITSVTDNVPPV